MITLGHCAPGAASLISVLIGAIADLRLQPVVGGDRVIDALVVHPREGSRQPTAQL